MLALRDQENLVHAHQTAAAAKPLNQGVKQLQPKTPGTRAPKTPFKAAFHDENNPLAFGKKTVKMNGGQYDTTKPGRNAFVTPFGAQNRAPLGMKTTNAKARLLQTPAPLKDTAKPEKTNNRRNSTAQRLKKSAPVVYQSPVQVQSEVAEDDVPDIEYMPPKPKELPDFPDDITYDTTFPQFQPRFRAVGLETLYRDEKAIARRQREYEENLRAYDQMADEMILKSLESVDFAGDDGIIEDCPIAEPAPPTAVEERRVTRATAAKARPTTSNVSTVRSRDAAAALSGTKTARATTASAHARSASLVKPSRTTTATSLLTARKTRTPTPTLTNTSTMRHTAAVTSSKTTLGYSKGRNVLSVLNKDANKENTAIAARENAKLALSPHTYLELYGRPPLGSAMWYRCRAAGCFDEPDEFAGGDDRDERRESVELPLFEEDEETRNFQLTL